MDSTIIHSTRTACRDRCLSNFMFEVIIISDDNIRQINTQNDKHLCLQSNTKWRLKRKSWLWIKWFVESMCGCTYYCLALSSQHASTVFSPYL